MLAGQPAVQRARGLAGCVRLRAAASPRCATSVHQRGLADVLRPMNAAAADRADVRHALRQALAGDQEALRRLTREHAGAERA